MGSNA